MSDFLEVIGEMKEAADRDTDNLEAARLRNQLYLWVERLEAALAQQDGAVDRNVESVRAKMLGRAAVGLAKYGVTTERGDLSHADWLKHLQEELMDAAVYIEAAIASSAPGGGGEGLRAIAKRNLRKLIELGSDDKRTMLLCLEELS